jgi:hypothetical protein
MDAASVLINPFFATDHANDLCLCTAEVEAFPT